jgi:hypothetical protein
MRDLLPGDLYEGWAEERRRELRGTYLALLLACDGVTRTAGIHTLSRRVAVAFGEKVPISRLVVKHLDHPRHAGSLDRALALVGFVIRVPR